MRVAKETGVGVKAKILIADDSPVIRRVYDMALGNHPDYEVYMAEDGLEGVEIASALDSLNLIVFDINMPKLDGLEMLGKIRELHYHIAVPAIAVTSLGHTVSPEVNRLLGIKAVIIKPFQPDKLLYAISRVLETTVS
jgi:two-component system, chemotaxis family, chemotaxis protein CheY